jgi:hypothetical protein
MYSLSYRDRGVLWDLGALFVYPRKILEKFTHFEKEVSA